MGMVPPLGAMGAASVSACGMGMVPPLGAMGALSASACGMGMVPPLGAMGALSASACGMGMVPPFGAIFFPPARRGFAGCSGCSACACSCPPAVRRPRSQRAIQTSAAAHSSRAASPV